MIDRAAVFAIGVKKKRKKKSVGAPAASASAQGGAWINRPSETDADLHKHWNTWRKPPRVKPRRGNEGAASHNANTSSCQWEHFLQSMHRFVLNTCIVLQSKRLSSAVLGRKLPVHHKATKRQTTIHTSTSTCSQFRVSTSAHTHVFGGSWRTWTWRTRTNVSSQLVSAPECGMNTHI